MCEMYVIQIRYDKKFRTQMNTKRALTDSAGTSDDSQLVVRQVNDN